MNQELRYQITIAKRRLRDRRNWWEEQKLKDVGQEKATRIMENLDRQKKLLDRMTTMLYELNKLQRDGKLSKVKMDIKLEKLYQLAS